MSEVIYSVWVGGDEVNDYGLTYEKAQEVSEKFRRWGYDDVEVNEFKETFFKPHPQTAQATKVKRRR